MIVLYLRVLIEVLKMCSDQIIIGQKVKPDKKELARKFRKEMTLEERILWRYLLNSALWFKFRRQ